MKKIISLILFLFVSQSIYPQTVRITERLAGRIQSLNPLQYTRVLILLRDRLDIEGLDNYLYETNAPIQNRAETVITALMKKASQTQGPIMEYLNSEKESGKIRQIINYWITNLIFIEATPDVLNMLTKRSDVDVMDLDAEIEMDIPTYEKPAPEDNIESVETGLKVIKADSLWKIGITGAGRTVMNIDGGVNGTHPALSTRWWGNNGRAWYHSWFDPIAPVSTSPFDCAAGGIYHGTHTMGIMCGRNAADTIGVAPDARWIAAGITDCPGASYPSMNIAAYQWAMNPDSNVATPDMPDVINCSWRDPTVTNECTSSIYRTTLTAVEAAGIAVVFSAGNSGPGASTITPPKNINIDSVHVFCVGAVDGSIAGTPIASFSSRGPSLCGGVGTLLIKPEVSAPGVSVRSSYSGISYAFLSGTSMASPHAAGCIALLKQAAPNLTGKQLKAILFSTATDLGTAGEDNTYGKGLINVNRAYKMLDAIPVAANISLIQEGFYNSASNVLRMRDTVRVYLRNISAPYAIVDSGKGVLDSVSYSASVLFSFAPSGTYYLQIKHRNCLDTWSKAGGEIYTKGAVLTYNFTTAQTQAFGSNMKLVDNSPGFRYGIYSGDISRDGFIDASDLSAVDNATLISLSGYVVEDVTGDNFVDASDISVVDNNIGVGVADPLPKPNSKVTKVVTKQSLKEVRLKDN